MPVWIWMPVAVAHSAPNILQHAVHETLFLVKKKQKQTLSMYLDETAKIVLKSDLHFVFYLIFHDRVAPSIVISTSFCESTFLLPHVFS